MTVFCDTPSESARRSALSKIHVLDSNLINKIAAGEVVERPASVVKELIENAFDAGSTRVEIEIHGGGIEYIRVSDNGCGMDEDDLILSFTRHATSKLSVEDDLWAVDTMGFRGEALPSIASVSQVEVNSNNGQTSITLTVNGGEMSAVKPAAAPPGTNIIVKDLFYNTPARRKFLKTGVTEGNQIYDTVTRAAISRPDISVAFRNENRLVFMTDGDGILLNAVRSIYGKDYAEKMLPFHKEFGDMTVQGLIGRPEFTRKNRKGQLFYVNGRSIRSALMSASLEDAFRGLLISQEKPVGIIFLTMPPDVVDVNVHPQKAEVRFRSEQSVFQAVKTAVRETLYASYNRGFTPRDEEPAFSKTFSKPSGEFYQHDSPRKADYDWANLFKEDTPVFNIETQLPSFDFKIYGQWQDSYLIFETEGTLEIMDQHAAHERIMFNQLKNAGQSPVSQELAVAVMIELGSDMMEQVEKQGQLIRELGYEVEIFGERSVIIRAVPAAAAGSEVEVLLEILDSTGEVKEWEASFDKGLKVMACKSAIKAGQKLNREEMEELIQSWIKTPDRYTCPHGRPVCISYDPQEMARAFKR